MGERKQYWLVSYDIREPKRWRRAYKLLKGWGYRLQLSVFRVHVTDRQFEKLRWELERRLTAEDTLLFVGLCATCVARVEAKNRPESWSTEEEEAPYRIV
jgi:CRISPR-associated protein Cas2